jgi:hypothetical protein
MVLRFYLIMIQSRAEHKLSWPPDIVINLSDIKIPLTYPLPAGEGLLGIMGRFCFFRRLNAYC